MAMLGGSCSKCCGDDGECCPSWGAAKRFIQSLAPLDGTEYTGLSINGEIQDTTFTVQSQSGGAEFIGSQVYPSTVRTGRNSAVAFARSDRNGCVYGFAQVSVPLGGYFLNAQGDRFRLSFGDDRYPTPPNDGSIVAVVPYYLLYVFFNWNSSPPSIDVFTSIRSTWFWVNNTSMPLITGVRFGGKSITATPWDGLSAPTIDNAVFGNAANIFPSSNCRRTQVDQRRVLEVPDSDYRGTLEIDLAFFRRFVAGVDENGDNLAGYALAESRTVTVQWDDMTEFEVDEDCSGACCEVDGSCNIKPQCECDTDNGAVFAGVGEGCDYCTTCSTGQWPFSFDANVEVSVEPGPEVGLVSNACYSGLKQQFESQSGQYLLTDFYSQLGINNPTFEEAYAGIFQYRGQGGGVTYQCGPNSPTYGTNIDDIWLMLDFRCKTSAQVPQQLSSIQLGADLGIGESTPPCNTREQDDMLCPCVDGYSLADRTLRGVGLIIKDIGAFVIPEQELQSQKPLENFLSGQFALQAVFPGYILGCFPSPSTQQKKTHIANVTVTIQAAGNPNPLP